jgi:hypothetical protein
MLSRSEAQQREHLGALLPDVGGGVEALDFAGGVLVELKQRADLPRRAGQRNGDALGERPAKGVAEYSVDSRHQPGLRASREAILGGEHPVGCQKSANGPELRIHAAR